jgi:phosphoribosylformylglycinamidine synthase
MLSESQERMLLVVKAGREAEVERIFEKWDLHAARIGHVTNDGRLRVREGGRVVAEIPNSALVDEAPVYDRPAAVPSYLEEVQRLDLSTLKPVDDTEALAALLASPTVASKRWIYRQYDHMIGTSSLVLDGQGAGVVRVKGTRRALAVSVDGNGRFCYLDPYQGAMLAVAEAARNVACSGAEPIGATNCLNFGNPERPDIMWQFQRAVAGIGDACRRFGIPITGGNVSFYNETDGRAIYPTPVVGVVGLIEDAGAALARRFPHEKLVVVALGANRGELGGTEYLNTVHGLVRGVPPALDLEAELRLQRLLVRAAAERLILSAHDGSDGGLAIALAECCFESGGVGADVDLPRAAAAFGGAIADTATLFGETPSQAIVSVSSDRVSNLLELAGELGVPAARIGRTGGPRLRIGVNGTTRIDMALVEAEQIWSTALERRFVAKVA